MTTRTHEPTPADRIGYLLSAIGGPALVEQLATILEYAPDLILPVIRDQRVRTIRASLRELRKGGC